MPPARAPQLCSIREPHVTERRLLDGGDRSAGLRALASFHLDRSEQIRRWGPPSYIARG
jgi:hypothetical protein